MDIINEYMKNNRVIDWGGVKRLQCNDGFSMSVQASEGVYCSPRVDPDETGYYFKVEIGYPSDREELIMQYAEDSDQPTDTVYGYVPVEVVVAVVEKHGGIKVHKETK